MDYIIFTDEKKKVEINSKKYTFLGSLFLPVDFAATVKEIISTSKNKFKIKEMKWSNIKPNKRGHGVAVGEIFNGIYGNPNINRCLLFNVLGVAEETLNRDRFKDGKYHEFYASYYGRFYRAQLKGGINYLLKVRCLSNNQTTSMFSGVSHRVIGVFHDKEGNLEMNMYSKILSKLRDEVYIDIPAKDIFFVDSVQSDFIQFSDVLLGVTVYSIDGTEERRNPMREELYEIFRRRIKYYVLASEFSIVDGNPHIEGFSWRKPNSQNNLSF